MEDTFLVDIGNGDTAEFPTGTPLDQVKAAITRRQQAVVGASRETLAKANATSLPERGGRTLLEDFATSGPMGNVLEGMNAGHEGNYLRAGHKISEGVGQVLAPAALPAIAAAPLVALGAAGVGAVGTVGMRAGASQVTNNPDLIDVAGDVGGLIGGFAGGKLTSAVARPGIRLTGQALRLSSGPVRRMAGRVLERLGGEAEQAATTNGAREIDARPWLERTIDVLKSPRETLRAAAPRASQTDLTTLGRRPSIRLADSRGASAPRVPLTGEPGEIPVENPTGARTLDMEDIPSSGRFPGSINPSIRLADSRGTSTPQVPYGGVTSAYRDIEEPLLLTNPSGARTIDVPGISSPRGLSAKDIADLRKNHFDQAFIDRLNAQVKEGTGVSSLHGTPLLDSPIDSEGRVLGGYAGPERRVTGGAGPEGLERRDVARTASEEPLTGTIPERAAAMRAENPNIDAEGAAMRARTNGTRLQSPRVKVVENPAATDEDIIALRTVHGAEEAGTKLAADPRFQGMSKTARTNTIRDLASDQAGLLPTSAQALIDARLRAMNATDAADYLAKAPNAAAYNYIKAQIARLGLE